MKDKNGKLIARFDGVLVPDPTDVFRDSHDHAFRGTVMGFTDKYVMVMDGDDDVHALEPSLLTIEND